MVIPIERLLVRVLQVPSRAVELLALRARLRRERAAHPSAAERAKAVEIRALKEGISAALGAVSSCTRCSAGKPSPRGVFSGGDCCSGVTEELFSDDEVAALAAAGTRPQHLRAPRTEHAGCAFRGELGCTLGSAHRPARCVHYTCSTLRAELRRGGQLAAIDAMLAELQGSMAEHATLRRTRLDDELLAPLELALMSPTSGAGHRGTT